MYDDTGEMMELVKNAYAGSPEAIARLQNIQALHASSADGANVVVIRSKHAIRQPGGRTRVLNKKSEPGTEALLCADIYRCLASGAASWTHIPLPPSFVPVRIEYEEQADGEDGRFVLESSKGRFVKAAPPQMSLAFRELDLVMTGATEAEIEEAFYGMERIVVPPPPVKRTPADNPPVSWSGGALTFEAEDQWFGGQTAIGDRVVGLHLETADRERALEQVPGLEAATANLSALDDAARRYAAGELVEAKNDAWLDEDEEELTEIDFAGKMTLESVTLDEDGTLTFWYEDGDLFWGHTICVRQSAQGEWLSAEMMG